MNAANVPVTIPNWLLGRFDSLYQKPPHYEASYYGPINMMLTTFFPSAKRFLVKPQARLRNPPAPGGRTSSDSYGQIVGTSDKDGNPDFLVSTGTSALDSDVPFLIYEIKRDDEDEFLSAIQMERYMLWAREYQRQVSPWARIGVYAVLVIGTKSIVYDISPDSEFINTGAYRDTTGREMLNMLQDLRDRHGI